MEDKMKNLPLALKLQPKNLKDIFGQDHLTKENGPLFKMIKQKRFINFVLYGNPGIGKTTTALCFANDFGLKPLLFNASTGTKLELKKICDDKNDDKIIIIDEIHRMRKDIQEYLLPILENGSVKIIGLTTVNPYISLQNSIRSRILIFKLNDLDAPILEEMVLKAAKFNKKTLERDLEKKICYIAGGDVRKAYNIVDMLSLSESSIIKECDLLNIHQNANSFILNNIDTHYELLSALQKSIRGSDVNASLYYTARLLKLEDLDAIIRRLFVIAYEDIGLSNPMIGVKMQAVAYACQLIGLPEARIPISEIVIEMALSPKSNSAYLAIKNALNACDEPLPIPEHLKNLPSFSKKSRKYLYPHDYKGAIIKQTYLPEKLKNKEFLQLKLDSKSEALFKENYERIKKILQ